MDYNSIHGPGISNFSSSPSPHRLPTVSAAQALNELNTSASRCISTGLKDLDFVLQNHEPGRSFEGEAYFGGISRGKVTEIWGPPGVGKTALGMQLVSSALNGGEGVVWVDASHPLPGPRFCQILRSYKPTTPQINNSAFNSPSPSILTDLLENFTYFTTPTLAHIIALLTHPTTVFPPPRTSLIIIDSFSTLISNAFPRNFESPATPKRPGAPGPSSRKFSVLQYLISSLQKLSATHNMAIVILSQCVTKMCPGAGAVLVPALNTKAWEQGLTTRVILFRDWGWEGQDGEQLNDVRLAEVVKVEGIHIANSRRWLVGFTIGEGGLQSVNLPNVRPQGQDLVTPNSQTLQASNESLSLPLPQKRKLGATDLEIPDSDAEDDEDYGWAEEDEEDVPPPPPQWQGSEDILVPPKGELEGEGEENGTDEEEQVDGEPGQSIGIEKGVSREIVEDSEDDLAL